MRRVFGDALMSAGALVVMLLVLVAVDDRVRDQLSRSFTGSHASAELADAGSRVQNAVGIVVDAIHAQALEHAPLMLFAFIGTVLVLFMLRT